MRRRKKAEREPTIALINIVFLMLIFFLVAGTIARPLEKDLALVSTADLEGRVPANALVIHRDGALSWRGEPVESEAAFLSGLPPAERAAPRIMPDRDLPAERLVQIGRALRGGGAEKVMIVTERGLR